MKTWKIYKVTSPTQKVYIGLTSLELDIRKNFHIAESKKKSDIKGNNHFHNAIRKYSNLKWEVIEDNLLTKEQAIEKEKYYIQFYESFKSIKGYNGTFGGEGCANLTNEVKQKIAKSVSEANLKRIKEEPGHLEYLQKQAKNIRNLPSRKINLRRVRQTPESRLKTSIATKKMFDTEEKRIKYSLQIGKKYFNVWKQDGTYIGQFVNQNITSEKLNLPKNGHISNCLNKRLCQYKGFVFAYINDKPRLNTKGKYKTMEYKIPGGKDK